MLFFFKFHSHISYRPFKIFDDGEAQYVYRLYLLNRCLSGAGGVR